MSYRPLGCPVCVSLQAVRVHMAKSHQLQVRAEPLAPVVSPPEETPGTPLKPASKSPATTRPTAPKEVPLCS